MCSFKTSFLKIYIFLLLEVAFSIQNCLDGEVLCEEECFTPNSTMGICKTISDCPIFLEQVKSFESLDLENSVSLAERHAHLSSFVCHSVNPEAALKVCCPDEPVNLGGNQTLVNNTTDGNNITNVNNTTNWNNTINVTNATNWNNTTIVTNTTNEYITTNVTNATNWNNTTNVTNTTNEYNTTNVTNTTNRNNTIITNNSTSVNILTAVDNSTKINQTTRALNLTNFGNFNENFDRRIDSFKLLPDPAKKECGKDVISDRIIGGTETEIDEYPWMAILKYEHSFLCAGTLINSNYILTAAHCLEGSLPHSVILGEYDTSQNEDCLGDDCADPIQTVPVESAILHPGWINSERKFYDDIALIRLRHPVNFTDFIKPICTPPENFNESHNTFTIAGWGEQGPAEGTTYKKMQVDLPMVDKTQCSGYVKRSLRTNQMCLGAPGKDSCSGDSGGPMMVKSSRDFRWYLLGVVSLGFNSPCGVYPGVYTYVPQYVPWILESLKP